MSGLYIERSDPHSVYRMFGNDGALLYVGCTGKLPVRLDQHRLNRPWWTDVCSITVEHHPDYTAAAQAEQAAIRAESPMYNVSARDSARAGWATRKARQDKAHRAGVRCNDAGCVLCRGRFGRTTTAALLSPESAA